MQNRSKNARLIEALVRARHADADVVWDGAMVPPDAREAYAAQLDVMDALAVPVRGCKVAIDDALGPVAAPLDLRDGPQMRLGKVLQFELEVAAVLASDLPPRRKGDPYTFDDIERSVLQVCCGVEFIRKRFDGQPNVPPLMNLADGLCQQAYLVGTSSARGSVLKQKDFTCTVVVNGETRVSKVAHPAGCPARPLLEFANNQIEGTRALRAGQIITTGSLCGLLELKETARVHVAIEGVGTLDFSAT
jgi:2-keto-4-pentenoate hydratase/2-oxohepta-3-ene-1,7-dioic acid hydratase in catechol pathway